jgi:UDP-glucuronate 4-epimerase
MKILVTGAAGFIGSQLMNRLKNNGHKVLGVDNYNDHLYDPSLKVARTQHFGLDIRVCDIRDYDGLKQTVEGFQPDQIVHLAAHAGVRDSFGKERSYHSNNIDGTQNLIEVCKDTDIKVIYSSTSSVYGMTPIPEEGWTEDLVTAKQRNAYAYTKYVNEIQFAISGVQNIGLRFFTVYGPWGRPDMALFDFTKKMLDKEQINVYNYGDMKRDFTYVEDILDGIELIINSFDSLESGEIFNIGYGQQVQLMDFVEEIEKNVGQKADINLAPRHPADTLETWSNTNKLQQLGYNPSTDVKQGISNFYNWYVEYHSGEND